MKHGWLGFWLRALLWGVTIIGSSRPASAEGARAGKSLGFSNLIFRPGGGDRIGIADQNFKLHILEDLRRRGLNAVGGEDLVFGAQYGRRADVVLGGTVTQLDCIEGSSDAVVTCRMAIEWQVLDVASEAVVYKLTSWGRVVDAPKEPSLGVGKALVIGNLDSLTRRPAFLALLSPSAAPAAAPARGYARANLRGCRAGQRLMPAASESVLDSTVLVQTSGGFGSGFLLSPDGFVATAAHVVTESSATVKLRDGREYPATVIRVDRRLDVALLRLATSEGSNLPCLPVKLDPVAVGADVYAVGSPARRELSFSLARGIVSGVRLLEGLSYLQTDAAVNRGNSGGPLVTATGEAAAIVSFKLSGASVEGIAFGVPLAPALNAVGVTVGHGFTSPELASAAAAPPAPAPRFFEDTPDVAPALDSSSKKPRSTSVQGVGPRRTSPEVKRGLYTWGAGLLVTGVLLVVTTSTIDAETYATMRNVGWVSTAAGGVLLGVGFALP